MRPYTQGAPDPSGAPRTYGSGDLLELVCRADGGSREFDESDRLGGGLDRSPIGIEEADADPALQPSDLSGDRSGGIAPRPRRFDHGAALHHRYEGLQDTEVVEHGLPLIIVRRRASALPSLKGRRAADGCRDSHHRRLSSELASDLRDDFVGNVLDTRGTRIHRFARKLSPEVKVTNLGVATCQ